MAGTQQKASRARWKASQWEWAEVEGCGVWSRPVVGPTVCSLCLTSSSDLAAAIHHLVSVTVFLMERGGIEALLRKVC